MRGATTQQSPLLTPKTTDKEKKRGGGENHIYFEPGEPSISKNWKVCSGGRGVPLT